MDAETQTGYWDVTIIMVVIASWILSRYVASKGQDLLIAATFATPLVYREIAQYVFQQGPCESHEDADLAREAITREPLSRSQPAHGRERP